MTFTRKGQQPSRQRPDMLRALPKTADREGRSIEVVWATGARAMQYDYWTGETFAEELDMGGADLGVLNKGAAVLDTHKRYRLSDQIAVVERAWVEKGEGRALVRFSSRPDVEPIMNDVMDGIIRSLSVGYSVEKYEVTEATKDAPKLYTARSWTPFEVSFVPVPADPSATVRSMDDARQFECEIIYPDSMEQQMTTRGASATGTAAAGGVTDPNTTPTTPPADGGTGTGAGQAQSREAILEEGRKLERERATAVRQRCESVRELPEGFAQRMIDEGVTAEQLPGRIVDELAKRSINAGGHSRPPATPNNHSEFTHDNPKQLRASMARALGFMGAQAQGLDKVELPDPSREFMVHKSPLRMLAAYATSTRGIRFDPYLSKSELYSELMDAQYRMHSISDFPVLLGEAAHRVLLAAYQTMPGTFRQIFDRTTFADFRDHDLIRSGDMPDLLKKTEIGEYEWSTMGESETSIRADEYGRIISFSRKMLINDNIGAFADLPRKWGAKVARWENREAWKQLKLNSGAGPTVMDSMINGGNGRPMFHSDHGNLAGSGAAPSVATLTAARLALRTMKDMDGNILGVTPRFIVVGPALETSINQLLVQVTVPGVVADTNPFRGTLTIIVEPEITGNEWYLFASPDEVAMLVYGYVDGRDGPVIASNEPFTTAGLEMRIQEDIGWGGVDFRGGYKNPGAA